MPVADSKRLSRKTRLNFVASVLVLVLLSSVACAIEQEAGWPYALPPSPGRVKGICAADLTGDGALEVVVNHWGSVIVLRHDGTPRGDHWPHLVLGNHGRPLVGDIDADGQLDIVVNTVESGPQGVSPPGLMALSAQGVGKAGWPVFLPGASAPLIFMGMADLNNDGADEVVVPALSDKRVYLPTGVELRMLVYAVQGDGSQLPGWPVDVDVSPWFPVDSIHDQVSLNGMATGDVDFDGQSEVVACYRFIDNGSLAGSLIFLFDSDGTVRPGWPQQGFAIEFPMIVDFNGDLECEIVAGGLGSLRAWRPDGSSYFLPVSTDSYREPVCGDVDGDGDLELVVAGLTGVRIYDVADGPVNATPFLIASSDPGPYVNFQSITVGDVDGDGVMEIAALSAASQAQLPGVGQAMHLFDAALQELPGWPQHSPTVVSGVSSVQGFVMADLDGDNDLEIIEPWPDHLNAWSIPNLAGGGSVQVEWSMRGHGPKGGSYFHEDGLVPQYVRGDQNHDGSVDVSDVSGVFRYLFFSTPESCPAALDVDGNGVVNLSDPMQLLNYLFLDGSASALPVPACVGGNDLSSLKCHEFSCP